MRMVKRGAILLAIGVFITVGSMALASATNGGWFIINVGPVIFGAIFLIQGGRALMSPEKLDQDQPVAPMGQYNYPQRPQQPASRGTWRPPGQ